MNICYLSTQENITSRLLQHFCKKHELTAFDNSYKDYSQFDLVLIVEPVHIKGHYLSVFEIWKLFLAWHAPKTKLLVAGFNNKTHPNLVNLLDINETFVLEKAFEKALYCQDIWEDTDIGNGYDDVSKRLHLFFKGHNYNSIMDAVGKVRQVLNNAELSLYGSPMLNREKEPFQYIWEKLLYPERKYIRHFYSRWYNYREYFNFMPFHYQLETVDADHFINELQQFFADSKLLAQEVLDEKETRYRKLNPFNTIGDIVKVFHKIDAKYIDPKSIGYILLIDDDESFHHHMAENLTSFSFHSINQVAQIKELDKDTPYDLILLDLELGEGILKGLDLVTELKALYPAVPLSIVTSHNEREYIELTHQDGADYFLYKSLFDAEKWTKLFILLLAGHKFSRGDIIIYNHIQKIEERSSILIVEDEKVWYERIADLSKEYQFQQAATIPQARDMLAQRLFDLIILDLYFKTDGKKKLEGLELLKEIKTDYPDIPLIVVTSESDPTVVKSVQAHRIERYLKKDEYDAQKWLEIINAFIELKKASDRAKKI